VLCTCAGEPCCCTCWQLDKLAALPAAQGLLLNAAPSTAPPGPACRSMWCSCTASAATCSASLRFTAAPRLFLLPAAAAAAGRDSAAGPPSCPDHWSCCQLSSASSSGWLRCCLLLRAASAASLSWCSSAASSGCASANRASNAACTSALEAPGCSLQPAGWSQRQCQLQPGAGAGAWWMHHQWASQSHGPVIMAAAAVGPCCCKANMQSAT
jgi:hypothetical protein